MLRRLFLITICCLFAALVVLLNSTEDREIPGQVVVIPKNHIIMEDMHLIHVMEDGGYMVLAAETAYFDNNTGVTTLQNTDIELIDSENHLTSKADRGIYEQNKRISTSGEIVGVWNDLNYTVAPDGVFDFDLTTNQGLAKPRVTLVKRNNDIRVNELVYDGNKKQVDFRGDVEMVISGDVME